MGASIFSDKKLLLIIVVWFIVSFLVLWLIGGGCLNPVNGSLCIAKDSFAFFSGVPVIGLFLPFSAWNSLMYFFAPIAGFILAVIVIRWWNDYFETKEASGIWFLVLLIIALLAGYYINLAIYDGESAKLNSQGGVTYSLYFCFSESTTGSCYGTVQKLNSELLSQAQNAGATSVTQYLPIAFWDEIKKSMYFVFILGAIAGWLPLFVGEIYKKYSESESS